MRKKSKRILAAALSAILIWNTCEWQPQAMAAGSLQRIGAETEADDTAETAEKEAALKKSALKASPSDASPSNAEVKDNRGESGTSKAEAGADADTGKAEVGADADTGKAEAGAESGANKAEAGANGAITGTEAGINGAPNGTATGAKIEAFLGLDEAIAVQKLTAGSPHRIILKNLTRTESLSKPPIRLGMAIMRRIRTTTAVPMSTHRFCRRNIQWERRQSFRKSAFS